MGGKGKGKSGPPPPPPAPSAEEAAKAKAEMQLKKRVQMEREKREAQETIAAAKELEAKKRDLEARIPTLKSHGIDIVPWDCALLGTHIAGGKGGGGGVDVVELPGGTAVCVRQGTSIITENIVDALAVLLGVPVARMRCIQGDSDEKRVIRDVSKKWSSWNIDTEMARFEKTIERMDPAEQAKIKRMVNSIGLDPCAVVEFVPGTSLDTAVEALESASPELLEGLGQLCALDLLINNMDRVPLPCWQNAGNLTNAIITPDGRIIGIDQQVNHIEPGLGLDAYLSDVRNLSAQVFRGSAPSITMSISSAIKKNCGVELCANSMDHVIQGMATVLRKAALEAQEGRFAETLAAAADRSGELKFDYDALIDPISMATKDVAFLRLVVDAVVISAGGQEASCHASHVAAVS